MTSLVDRILTRIEGEGPLPFEEFMRMALYDPGGGFFASGVVRSARAGDFLTSPEVSDVFGRALGRFVERESRRLSSRPMVVEVGAGSGSLLGPLLDEVGGDVEAWAVEASPPARRSLAAIVGAERVVEDVGEVPGPISGVVVANELVDNLPMAVAQRIGGGWRELWVGAGDEGLVLVEAPPRRAVLDWLERYAGPVPDGGLVEVQLEACAWLEQVLGSIEEGAVVVIDYGDTADNLAPRRREGTLRTYRAHHLGPHPLAEPGATDITADVNFTALMDVARRCGATVEMGRQDEFLTELGVRDLVSELRERELERARFGDELRRLELRSRRHEVETLLHPRGLGDFRVLVARR